MSTVLIVEKAKADRERLEKLLPKEQLDVESIADGRELLGKLKTSMPDLVVLDLKMPSLPGGKVTNLLNKLREHQRRVVLVTAKGSLDTARNAFGADGYLEKPVDRKKLLTTIRQVLANPDPRQ